MFNYFLKNLPAKYVFAGYSIRKSVTILTTEIDGEVIYDTFEYTYLDNYLSFYILMDNGMYKNVDKKIEVPEAKAEDLMSRHLGRGKVVETDDNYDKDKIVGVFGVRDMGTLIKQVDEMKKQDEGSDVSLEAMLDIKSQYMGVEILGIINSFNNLLKYPKATITIPAIKNSPEDTYESIIGDEIDFFDLVSNKDSDAIVRDLKLLSDNLDGIGNVKRGKEIVITKGTEETAGTLEVLDQEDDNYKGTLQMPGSFEEKK